MAILSIRLLSAIHLSPAIQLENRPLLIYVADKVGHLATGSNKKRDRGNIRLFVHSEQNETVFNSGLDE